MTHFVDGFLNKSWWTPYRNEENYIYFWSLHICASFMRDFKPNFNYMMYIQIESSKLF